MQGAGELRHCVALACGGNTRGRKSSAAGRWQMQPMLYLRAPLLGKAAI